MRTCARRIGEPLSAATICPRMIDVPRGASARCGCARIGRCPRPAAPGACAPAAAGACANATRMSATTRREDDFTL